MTEQQFQTKIIKLLKKHGYYTIKIIRANLSGTPDVLAIRGGRASFIEVKSKKGIISEVQKYRIKEIRESGCYASVWREGDNLNDRIKEIRNFEGE